MLTDILIILAAGAAGWFARDRFGSYQAMKKWVKDLLPQKPDA